MAQQLSSHKTALKEEFLNATSHAIAAVAALVGFVFLIVYSAIDDMDNYNKFKAIAEAIESKID